MLEPPICIKIVMVTESQIQFVLILVVIWVSSRALKSANQCGHQQYAKQKERLDSLAEDLIVGVVTEDLPIL